MIYLDDIINELEGRKKSYDIKESTSNNLKDNNSIFLNNKIILNSTTY